MKTEPLFETLLAGSTNRKQLQITWQAERPARDVKLQRCIEKYWQDDVTAGTKRHFIFNGALCSLLAWEMRGTDLYLELGQTDYRELLYSNYCQAHQKTTAELPFNARALGVSLVLTTADDQVIILRRSGRVGEAPGKLDVVGGHIDPREHMTAGIPDPYVAIRAETAEEVGVQISLDDLVCIGLLQTTQTRKPEMVFACRTVANADHIIKVALRTNSSEASAWLSLQNSGQALLSLIETQTAQLSPSAAGALWLQAHTVAMSQS